MISTKHFNKESNIFLFFIFFAIINGASWAFADSYDHMANVDVQTYVGLSNFDFDQNPVRRYRVIIPFLAAAVKFVLGPIFSLVSPNEFPGDFPTIISFLIVNNVFMTLYALVLFKITNHFVNDYWASFIGVLSVLTCRWTVYLAGSALVDSLFLLVVGMLLLGILRKNLLLIIITIYLGPWAKEAYIFFLPLMLFVDKKHWVRCMVHLILSGIIVFSYRYLFDLNLGESMTDSLSRDISHFEGIPKSLNRLFSFHGLYELLSIGGLWNLILLFGSMQASVRKQLSTLDWRFWLLFMALILFQALLSFELARMFYLSTPLFALMVAITFVTLKKKV